MSLFAVQQLTTGHLAPVDFTLPAGSCMAVKGRSGAGKSLLLRALADLDPSTGKIHLDGRERNSFTAPGWRRRVRYLAAEPGWWADHVATHFRNPDRVDTSALLLEKSILAEPVARLSTGERQRLALLRALEDGPSVLLLDEPTAALDPESTKAAEALIRAFLKTGGAVILVSHDPDQTGNLADRRYLMDQGRLSADD